MIRRRRISRRRRRRMIRRRRDQEEEDGPLAQAVAERNTLFLALRDEGVARVVKYVSALAPGSRWDVALEASVRAED